MFTRSLVSIGLLYAVSFEAKPAEVPDSYFRRGVPDLTQTDVSGSDTGDGQQYCAPVAASNSLMWLANRGRANLARDEQGNAISQVEIARLLGSKGFMNTSLGDGTNPSQVLSGLKNYLAARNSPAKQFGFQGWRNLVFGFQSAGNTPELGFLRQGLMQDSIALLNIGWYSQKAGGVYHRDSGHWVTLVGYEPGVLIIHDPSPRAGSSLVSHRVTLKEMREGTLVGKNTGLPTSAAGYFQLGGELRMRKGADLAILDGVLVIEM